jgi:hypothetical protein
MSFRPRVVSASPPRPSPLQSILDGLACHDGQLGTDVESALDLGQDLGGIPLPRARGAADRQGRHHRGRRPVRASSSASRTRSGPAAVAWRVGWSGPCRFGGNGLCRRAGRGRRPERAGPGGSLDLGSPGLAWSGLRLGVPAKHPEGPSAHSSGPAAVRWAAQAVGSCARPVALPWRRGGGAADRGRVEVAWS